MHLSPRSMAAMWLAGFEEDPDDSGEICVVEVFGRSVQENRTAEIGVGVKQLHDPRLLDDFVARRLEIDVSEFHTYEVQWNADAASFSVDELKIHACEGLPTYRLQAMLAVFDFPGRSTGADDHLVPSLDVDWVAGTVE